MKLDKEWALKQRFWLLLGTFGLLWFVCLIVLWLVGSGPIEAAQTAFKAAGEAIQPYTARSGPKVPKNESFLPKWVDYGVMFKNHKNKVWKIAWDGDEPNPDDPPGKVLWPGQKGMYTWPSTEDHPLNRDVLSPAKEIEAPQRQWYKGSVDDSPYRNQFNSLYYELKSTPDEVQEARPSVPLKALDPVVFKGSDRSKDADLLNYLGVMQLVDINAEKVTNPPSTEECWLMQEDFCVKRELLYVFADAMNMAAHMDVVDAPPSDKSAADPQIRGRHTFRNDSWEVTLLFDQNGKDPNGVPTWRVRPDSTIKNVHVSHRDQDLGSPIRKNGGVWFQLRQGAAVWKIAFEGTPVPWDQTHTMADGAYKDGWSLKGNPDPSKPMALEQVFDATNAPITEIDEIAIPKVSHKNANRLLIPAKPERYGQKPAAPAGAPGVPAPGAPAGAPVMPAGSAVNISGQSSLSGPAGSANTGTGMGGGLGGGTQASTNLTPNYKLDRDRYLFVTEQSRHLPLAVTLTVDQSHLHEVLAAFANSRLRFQTTQVEFRRVPAAAPSRSMQPNGFPGFPGPGGTIPPMPNFPGPAGSVGNGAAVGDQQRGERDRGNGGWTVAGAAATERENPNLIEVTVYGIASLYERPPDAK